MKFSSQQLLLALAAVTAMSLFQGCDGAPLTACLPVGTNLNGQWQVRFADQQAPVVWQLSQCATDVRGSELRDQASIALQGSLKGSAFSVVRTPRSRTEGLDYSGKLITDNRIEGTFTGTLSKTGFTAIRVVN